MNIQKERGINMITNIERTYHRYTLTFDDNKKIVVDYDNNCIIGVSGKAVKSTPTIVKTKFKIRFLCDNLLKGVISPNQEYIDRIISLPNFSIETKLHFMYLFSVLPYAIDKSYWKTIIKMMNDYQNDPKEDFAQNWNGHSLSYLIGIYIAKNLFQTCKYNFPESLKESLFKCCKEMNDDCLKHLDYILSQKAFREAFNKIYKNYIYSNNIHQEILTKYSDGENKDILREKYGIVLKDLNKNYLHATLLKCFKKIFGCIEYLNLMRLNDYKFSNLERDYEYLKTLYNENRTKIENEFFSTHQTKINLNYSNENCGIYIPKSREELATIGKTFNNCANGWEWNNWLRNGSRYLVVVVSKLSNEMLVCCDVDSEDLTIVQYYGKNNSAIREQKLLNFEKEYQNYLNTLKEGA